MTARRPPQPEPPPRRRRRPVRRPWRTAGPVGEVDVAQLAERVMKARGESVCHRCGTVVITGQMIGQVDGDWIHVACLLNRQPMIGPHTGA
jgi:hypothetical protein